MGRVLSVAEKTLNNIAWVVLVAMMLMVTIDVGGRYLFNHPLRGTMEISEFMLAAVVFFPLAFTQALKGHIHISVVTERLPRKGRLICEIVAGFLGLVVFGLLVWHGLATAWDAFQIKDVHAGVPLPMWPSRMFIPVGSLLLCFRYIADIVQNITQLRKGQGE